jgi:hypothetical protein
VFALPLPVQRGLAFFLPRVAEALYQGLLSAARQGEFGFGARTELCLLFGIQIGHSACGGGWV